MIAMKKVRIKVELTLLLLLTIFFSFNHLNAETNLKEKGDVSKPPQKEALTSEEKRALLKIAREVLNQYLKDGTLPKIEPESLSPVLKENRGCFVTLMKKGKLRGCIGYLQPKKPLCDCVIENAINAALHDFRFPEPVSFEELKEINIEISVLTVPKRMELKNRSEILDHLVPGRDGVILRNGRLQATYLPQVWEHFPDKESFLDYLCQKGSMLAGCWKDPSTEIYTYQAEVFHEGKD
jgi:AmmeMemoRadiSam system protein A